MAMVMGMVMTMHVTMTMIVVVMAIIFRQGFHTTLATIKTVAVTLTRTILWRDGANAFHMVVVAFLWQTDLIFKAQHLRAIFTKRAVHCVLARIDLL